MKKFIKPVLALFVTASLFTACKRDEDPEPDDDHDEITTISLRLVNAADPTDVVEATWRDVDGPGGQAPTIDELDLKDNATYNGTIRFLHESEHNNHFDVEDLTDEIREDGNSHEVFYTPSAGLNLTVTKTDQDSQGRPIGLSATFVTGADSHGDLRVRLMHQPGIKPTPGSFNVGETDVDITFPVHIH
jgi:hypothetical protein